ncbi:MAG: hypothetical protein M0R29_25830 [Aquamicrobium sp.]|nr:hypothetical protein [Aquamicrobium sp.]
MKKILIGILLINLALLARDVNDGNAEGAGVSAAFSLNSKPNIPSMTNSDKMNACENKIKALKADRSRPFLENYDQAMNIAVNACLKELK